jgi:drug/metabolite transporter (DMT)-like permease
VPEAEGRAKSSATVGRRYVLAAAVLWSAGGALTKGLGLDGPTIAFYRGLFAGLALLPFVPPRRWSFRPAMLPSALVFGAMTGFYIAAVKATTAANAIFLQCTSTFWVVPFGFLFLRERPDRRALAGIALAMVGIAAIVLYGHDPSRSTEGRGIALGLASGVGYALVVVSMRGLRDVDPVWLSAINNLGGALVLGAWIRLSSGPIVVPAAPTMAVLAAFGIVQMAIPYTLFARGLRDVGAAEAGLLSLVEPVLNPIWVVLIHHERPAPATLIGGLFLLAGVACRYVPAASTRPADRG